MQDGEHFCERTFLFSRRRGKTENIRVTTKGSLKSVDAGMMADFLCKAAQWLAPKTGSSRKVRPAWPVQGRSSTGQYLPDNRSAMDYSWSIASKCYEPKTKVSAKQPSLTLK